MSGIPTVTTTAPVNIAVLKYWGKEEETLIIPTNPSLSWTLHQDDLCSKTTVYASKSFEKNQMWLNGKEEDLSGKRLARVISEVQKRAGTYDRDGVVVKPDEWKDYKIHIVSENNFPTAAGLASSASGLACLVSALSRLYGVKESFPGELSTLARQGSGSACRSLYGGAVKWVKGSVASPDDSKAVQVAPESHWPELRILVLVVNDARKDTSSTSGMQTSVKTSVLLQERIRNVCDSRLAAFEKAIQDKDFPTFAQHTMADSNQFHAVCLDTYPPIFYMNDTSRSVVRLIHKYNQVRGHVGAAYTFDAGPNAVIYTLADETPHLLRWIAYAFPPAPSQSLAEYYPKTSELEAIKLGDAAAIDALGQDSELSTHITAPRAPGGLKYILSTRAGPGPIERSEHLKDPTA